ncbi:MAG: hypothetical protein AAFX50_03105 [Acidobacteriota bacterium]
MSITDPMSTDDLSEHRRLPFVRIGLEITDGGVRFVEITNTRPKVLRFDLETRTLTSDPRAAREPFPFEYRVQFLAANFRFRGRGQSIFWEVPEHRPGYIDEPVLEAGDQLLLMRVTNEGPKQTFARFLLVSEGLFAAGVQIDPTIVNNPDPPPSAAD